MDEVISFSEHGTISAIMPHYDALVNKVIIYLECFEILGINKAILDPALYFRPLLRLSSYQKE